MAKDSRRSKRSRANRDERAARQRSARQKAAARQQQAAEEAMRVVWERLERIYDPGTPAGDLAGLLGEQYGGEPVPADLVTLMLERGSSAGRLASAAETMLAAHPDSGDGTPSVTALTFGAAVAGAGGDSGKARHLLDQALAAADDPDTRLDVIEHLRESGRRAEAIELFEAWLREEPDDLHAAEHYAGAIEDAFARLTEERPSGERATWEEPAGEQPAGEEPAGEGATGEGATGTEPAREGAAGTEPAGEGAAGADAAGKAPAGGRPAGEQTAGPCPCGQGAPWEECCGPRERAALSRFTDRSGLTALRQELGAYAARSGHRAAIEEEAASWLPSEEAGTDPAERATLADLAAEHGLLVIGTGDVEEDGAEDFPARGEDEEDASGEGESGEDEDTAIAAFAADPSVPPELAARARAWRRHMHYGLWQANDPGQAPSPGLWCTDIATGISRYLEAPADLAGALPRWAVWLGGAAPADGIWRFTGPGMRLSPVEGDAAVQLVQMATEALAYEIAGKPRKSDVLRRAADSMPFGHAEPHGVLVALDDPAPPLVTEMMRLVTGALLPRIVSEVCGHRAGDGPGDPRERAAASLAASDARRWLDEPLPALRGRTPRRAARSRERAALEALLRQFEYESGLPAAKGKPTIDTTWLRRELDMDDGPPATRLTG